MKKLNDLREISGNGNVRVRIHLVGGRGSVRVDNPGEADLLVVQQDGDTLGDMFGQMLDAIQDEYAADEPDDEVVIKISVRLDQQVGERWTAHQFRCSQTTFAHLPTNVHQALSIANREFKNTSRPYGEWFDIITVIIRRGDGMWVDLRIARDEDDSGLWRTQEDYRSIGKSARFIDKMEAIPTPFLICGFIKNALELAETIAKRDNPAIS
jgi:hypothetical protein